MKIWYVTANVSGAEWGNFVEFETREKVMTYRVVNERVIAGNPTKKKIIAKDDRRVFTDIKEAAAKAIAVNQGIIGRLERELADRKNRVTIAAKLLLEQSGADFE
jgi:hypothetical protein